MKNTKWLQLVALVLPLLSTNAYAIVIPGLANTGVDGIGNPDSNYTLISSPYTVTPPAEGINKNPFGLLPLRAQTGLDHQMETLLIQLVPIPIGYHLI